MVDWIKLEAYLFITNIIGISVFLLMKTFKNRFHICKAIIISQKDERCMKLSDSLSKYAHDALAVQWVFNNFMVSLMSRYV